MNRVTGDKFVDVVVVEEALVKEVGVVEVGVLGAGATVEWFFFAATFEVDAKNTCEDDNKEDE